MAGRTAIAHKDVRPKALNKWRSLQSLPDPDNGVDGDGEVDAVGDHEGIEQLDTFDTKSPTELIRYLVRKITVTRNDARSTSPAYDLKDVTWEEIETDEDKRWWSSLHELY